MKSALFVDFDNVYSGLRRLDQETADQFARNPTIWMNWLIKSLEMPEPVAPGAKRRVLVRRCYLNPQAYQRFRPSFNLAGFEIIDCPALTSEGKTSTDINMVLDIVDLLQHETHYDEFIVFSADADFTPVLRKLRRWDRRTGQAVPCGRLATVLIGLDGGLAADWAGKGTFRKFVESLDTKPIEFNWSGSGGVAYDSSMPTAKPFAPAQTAADWADKNLYKIARQIHELTDVPLLTPDKYRNLIAMIASDVAETPFHLMETGKRVRDRCKESGLPVSRADVNHVLRGLSMRGHVFDEGPNDAATLAQKLANNVRSLCLREQFVLDEQADKAIRDWIGCKLPGKVSG